MKQYQGRIVKGIGGFYYVDTADGLLECRARGVLRKEKITPLVGDRVVVSIAEGGGLGAVDEILPRQNVLVRPPVANVDRMAVVVSATNPKPNLYLLDKMLAAAERAELTPLICWNKTDLDDDDAVISIYLHAGFDVLPLSAETGANLELLREKLNHGITVFAGNSGVGKSSLINRLLGKEAFATGAVSDRVERGKHTTRHSELTALPGGGYLIDTPGFGTLDLSDTEAELCAVLFREFLPYLGECRFRDCSHTVEKGCRVLQAVQEGEIAASRHESYCRMMEEIKNLRRKR